VRWNLQGLREANLIRAGDRENKGVPVELTDAGRIMASIVAARGD
jgi:antitoxin (DNA-binding transcriptional repressor) of toxin-antitoxin stability system